jgi:flavodoxin
MKTLVAYYSRSGKTEKIAEAIQTSIGGEIERILDQKDRSGILGWLSAGRDAGSKNLTAIKKVEKNPADYDVVIIGSPTWGGTVSTPIRTYINQYINSFRKVACFSTGDGEDTDALDEMDRLLGNNVIAKMHLVRKEVDTNHYHENIERFVSKIKNFMQ